ncbi:hypothetical protein [Archangium sp.]|uniref:hypothetical protein n=1 Tax=Archangium sp. TaxID=1872627 RepID=UPI002D2B77E8|nr:hypothetical protein [Archangium sp.]HYO55702.1 hypothetical protein [Archangium sp.]
MDMEGPARESWQSGCPRAGLPLARRGTGQKRRLPVRRTVVAWLEPNGRVTFLFREDTSSH